MQSNNPRLIALQAISAVLDDGHHLPSGNKAKDGDSADGRNLAQGRHLAYSVMRWLIALEWLAGQLLDRPMKARDRDVYRLILLGLAQLWLDDGAEHAAVHETAECARAIGKTWAVGLVNAILQRFLRERAALLAGLDKAPERWAHPRWLQDQLSDDWPDQWRSIVAANNQRPPLWLRLNTSRHDHLAASEMLEQANFALEWNRYVPRAVRIDPPAPVTAIPGFAQGRVSVQDAAAQLAAGLLGAENRSDFRVLDACAAPGGKTCHILENCPRVDLTAIDLEPGRVELVQENLDRLGLKCQLIAGDALDPEPWWDQRKFDRILLDAPCSATGVIRRHPEIRHLRGPRDVDESVKTQAALLHSLWPLLRPGGMLVYATCSVLDQENSPQV